MLFGCPLETEYELYLRDLSLQKAFYARIKTSELKNVEKLGEETVQACKCGLQMCILYNLCNYISSRWSLKI